MAKPSIPKGTRDFLPLETARRKYIFDTIQFVFEKCGYQPIETPAMERLDTLLGKYGEEGDRLIFKLLKRGEALQTEIEKGGNEYADQALRYDLTVPFARYVVQHQNDLTFPFKRYQIQPVWRADRPQRGRYREFYQCDVDVIGSNSLLNEVELVQIIDAVFLKLGLKQTTIKFNNRKVLLGMAQVLGVENRFTELTTALDKLDKIGTEKVMDELRQHLDFEQAINDLLPYMILAREDATNSEKINKAKRLLKGSEVGLAGLNEIEQVVKNCQLSSVNLKFDVTLARGLNYYTGAIFEVVTQDFPGSICGGGRYDDLTGIFGLKNVSGVGISFGADRIYDVMTERNLFPKELGISTQVMFANFGEEEALYCLQQVNLLRENGISAELYPDSAKLNKQMKYANGKGIPNVILVGSSEIESGKLTVKNMDSGEQLSLTIDELIGKLV